MVSKKEKQVFIASSNTLWLLFIPIATISKTSLIDQIIKEMVYDDDDYDEFNE